MISVACEKKKKAGRWPGELKKTGSFSAVWCQMLETSGGCDAGTAVKAPCLTLRAVHS